MSVNLNFNLVWRLCLYFIFHGDVKEIAELVKSISAVCVVCSSTSISRKLITNVRVRAIAGEFFVRQTKCCIEFSHTLTAIAMVIYNKVKRKL